MDNNIVNRVRRLLQAGSFILAGALLIIPTKATLAGDFDDSKAMHIDYPAWFKESPFVELNNNLGQAHAVGKQGLMVLFTTEGCSYCDLFIKKSLGDPEIATRVQKDFDSIGLEIFDDADMVTPTGEDIVIKDFANRERAEFSPTILFYGKDGERLLRVIGYQSPARFKKILDYMEGKHYLAISLAAYMKQQVKKDNTSKATVSLVDDPMFGKPPYLLQRNVFAASQPMLVLFEEKGSYESSTFHEKVLALKEVREALGKFEVVRFDANDNKTRILAPDGSRTTPAAWYKKTGFSRLPALLFVDERGNEVLKTDALVLRQRMMNSVNFVLERAYEKNWTYQRFARSKAIERNLEKQKVVEK